MKIAILSSLIVAVSLVTGCSPKVEVEGVAELNFDGRPTHRMLKSSAKLARGYEAQVSHGHFTDEENEEIDFVEISIEKPTPQGSEVSFSKAFGITNLPEDILSKDASEIVAFDKENNQVVFNLGTARVKSSLPR